ncbi:MAG: sugar ABC transporter ATP-binding protein [Ancalomicrobiaceae bacterium]|nr:sugar ABC transporter ATP-binding protein [Ancalomicrobiaceae bacterium]
MTRTTLLEVKNIGKSFPGVRALDDVCFSVREGSVHVLCGENGAGKSTLMKIINGLYQPDSGETFIRGQKVTIDSPIKAGELGISMIFQELNYTPEMTIEESLFVGRWPKKRFGQIDWKTIRTRTLELLQQENLAYDPETKLKDLSISNLQMLEILKAISRDADIIIMDEPTSSITNKEIEILFEKINDLRSRGKAIVYISHKMDEIFRIADDISILRDGRVVETRPKEQFDIDSVIALMVGRALDHGYPKEEVPRGDIVLEVENFSGPTGFDNISFNARKGEIVGFAGLVGAGRSEVMRALFGLDEHWHGSVKVHGVPVKIRSVQDSIKNGVVMLSEDRRRYGIVQVRDVKENVTLASMGEFFHGGRLHGAKERNRVEEICAKINVKMASIDVQVSTLSGGNQQKVVLSKWMLRNPDILILDEPTRGIDVGAKVEIYKLMTALVKEGKSIIVVSSELPELIGMCDRMYVMAGGRITGELARPDFSQETIMRYAMNMLKRAS